MDLVLKGLGNNMKQLIRKTDNIFSATHVMSEHSDECLELTTYLKYFILYLHSEREKGNTTVNLAYKTFPNQLKVGQSICQEYRVFGKSLGVIVPIDNSEFEIKTLKEANCKLITLETQE